MATGIGIALESGNYFPAYQPINFKYFMGFSQISDFIIIEAALVEELNIVPKEVFTISLQPALGDPFSFKGRLYKVEVLSEARHVKLFFVSSFFLALKEHPALFGKNNISGIIKSFYAKAGISKFEIDNSEVSLDNVLFPRGTDLGEAIKYLKSMAAAEDQGYICSTVVGEKAYIRNIKNEKKTLTGLYYNILAISDQRKSIDIDGGISIGVLGDGLKASDTEITLAGQNETLQKVFSTYSNFEWAKNQVIVSQRVLYYNNYTAVLGIPGWLPMIGYHMEIGDQDIYENQETKALKRLMRGKYFVNSQIFMVDFKSEYESCTANIQFVKDNK